jgi:hypothetical protein
MATKIRVELEDRDRGWRQLRTELQKLTQGPAYARAGIIGPRGEKQHDKGEPVTIADIALFQEFGTRTIPARSFIREPFDANRAGYLSQLKQLVGRVYEGKASLRQVLGLMGLRVSADQRKRITEGEGIPPPLAEATVKEKGSSRPLVDKGQLWRALIHDVIMGRK